MHPVCLRPGHKPGEPFNAVQRPGAALAIPDAFTPPLAENALAFLSRIGSGMRLTATGDLTRLIVAETLDAASWSGLEPADTFVLHEGITEPDFLDRCGASPLVAR